MESNSIRGLEQYPYFCVVYFKLSSVLSYNSAAVVCCGELLKAVSADESHMGELIKPYLESEQQGMPPHLLYTYCQMGQSYTTSETPVCKLQSSVSCFWPDNWTPYSQNSLVGEHVELYSYMLH